MQNYADLGGCYPPQPSASADNTLLDLHNSSYHTQPHPIIANYIEQMTLNKPSVYHKSIFPSSLITTDLYVTAACIPGKFDLIILLLI